MTEFLVPGVGLVLTAALAAAGIVMWRRAPVQTGAKEISVSEPAPFAEPAPPRGEEESIVLDPVLMNITNRVAHGSHQSGVIRCEGGLWVEGTIEGSIYVTGGPLVLMPTGLISGRIVGDGDAYLSGTIRSTQPDELSEVDVLGAVVLTKQLRAQANITAGAINSYEGAQVEGRIKTLTRASR